mmetsp:Transcript_53193/g.113655  ORF Transcript_53193/g.113655 Transcript_53193/m.113655 type:complete len:202 (-) Transcript_53193:609-1214(-)
MQFFHSADFSCINDEGSSERARCFLIFVISSEGFVQDPLLYLASRISLRSRVAFRVSLYFCPAKSDNFLHLERASVLSDDHSLPPPPRRLFFPSHSSLSLSFSLSLSLSPPSFQDFCHLEEPHFDSPSPPPPLPHRSRCPFGSSWFSSLSASLAWPFRPPSGFFCVHCLFGSLDFFGSSSIGTGGGGGSFEILLPACRPIA